MIPYFTIPSIHLFGPVWFHPFGLLFILGIILSYQLIMKRSGAAGIPPREMNGALTWTFVAGLVGAHVIEILLYQPESVGRDGLLIFVKVFTGLSSIGALFGGLLGFWLYFKRRNRSGIRHLAIMTEGFVIWWAFVRLGCTLAHDHLGSRTAFFMAFNYPTGARHNLGFYELLMVVLVLFPLTIILRRRQALPRKYVGAIFVTYGGFRFALDFLRATDVAGADPRYWGLTAAQYGCIVLMLAGLWMLLLSSSEILERRTGQIGPGKYPREGASIN